MASSSRARSRNQRDKRKKQRARIPRSADTPKRGALWPRRFAGIEPRKVADIRFRAACLAGEALKRKSLRNQPIDPIASLIMSDDKIAWLVGRPTLAKPGELWPDIDAPSAIEIDRGSTFVSVRLYFRGARVITPYSRRLEDQESSEVARGDWLDSERLFSMDALRDGATRIQEILRRAGCIVISRSEAFIGKGSAPAHAHVYIKRLSPELNLAPTMARSM